MNLYHAKMLPVKQRQLVKQWEKDFDNMIMKLQNELEADGIKMTFEDIVKQMDKEGMRANFADICKNGTIHTIDIDKNVEDERAGANE